MTMPAQLTHVTHVKAVNTHQLSVTTTRHASYPRVILKMDVHTPLSPVTMAIYVLLKVAIISLANAIIQTLSVMTTTRALLTVVILNTVVYTRLSRAMTTTFVQMTRAMRIQDAFIRTYPASVKQETNAQ
jgi:hypothetical protein